MSNQQRVRPNASPSTKPGPLRATVPVALMRQGSSPTNKKNSPTDSPTLRLPQGLRINRQSPPENRINLSPERKCSPILQAEKSQTLQNLGSRGCSASGGVATGQSIRRTSSLDGLHLGQASAGQWPPRDYILPSHTYCGRLMVDRATQTSDEWEDGERKRSQKKSNDSLEMRYMRQRLQRTTVGNRVLSPQHQLQQPASSQSPGQPPPQQQSQVGAGSPTGSTASSCMTPTWPLSPQSPSILQSRPQLASLRLGGPEGSRAAPIPIPHIPKPLVPRLRNSVEGLNQEIERLVLKEMDLESTETEKCGEHTLDGHRAPIAKMFHWQQQQQQKLSSSATSSVDTQTLSGGGPCNNRVESSSSGGGSPSPPAGPLLLIPGQPNYSSRPPSGKSASPELYGYSSSKSLIDCSPPQINRFLTREPPDGCEKVKVIEEPSKQAGPSLSQPGSTTSQGSWASVTSSKDNSLNGPSLPRPCMNFVLLPSQSSAFCPLYKPYLPLSNSVSVSTPGNQAQHTPSAPPSTTFNERLQ